MASIRQLTIMMNPERYCHDCGQETGQCQCRERTVVISIDVIGRVSPRIQISSDKCCHKCGGIYGRSAQIAPPVREEGRPVPYECSCGWEEEKEQCCHKCGHTYSRCTCGKKEQCCHKCGHTYSRCTCGWEEEKEQCCHKCGHTYSRCSCNVAVIDSRLDRY